MIRNLLIASVVFNSILVAVVVGLLPFFLFLSAVLNVAAGFYIAALIKELRQYNLDFVDILNTCNDLRNHIEEVHEMEMFYGEPVLQGLIDHTKRATEEMEFYLDKYSDSSEEENIDDQKEKEE